MQQVHSWLYPLESPEEIQDDDRRLGYDTCLREATAIFEAGKNSDGLVWREEFEGDEERGKGRQGSEILV